jgi:hypothetical protein
MNPFTESIERRFVENTISHPERFQVWLEDRAKTGCRRLLLAAAPKSGSTYLTALLGHLTGLKARDLISGSGRRDYQIYLPRLVGVLDSDTLVGHQHMRATETDTTLLKAFGFQVIVLVRNFGDTVVSLRDEQMKTNPGVASAINEFQAPSGLDEDTHYEFIIRHIMPWFFSFYASWNVAERQSGLPIAWICYEDLISNPHSALSSLSGFCGFSDSPGFIEQAIKKAGEGWTRKNVGVSGRGSALLKESHWAALREMASLYHNCDFSMVGLQNLSP